jgi:hypothetical protein
VADLTLVELEGIEEKVRLATKGDWSPRDGGGYLWSEYDGRTVADVRYRNGKNDRELIAALRNNADALLRMARFGIELAPLAREVADAGMAGDHFRAVEALRTFLDGRAT